MNVFSISNIKKIVLCLLFIAYYLFALAHANDSDSTKSAAAVRSSKFTLVYEIALSTFLVLFYKQMDK